MPNGYNPLDAIIFLTSISSLGVRTNGIIRCKFVCPILITGLFLIASSSISNTRESVTYRAAPENQALGLVLPAQMLGRPSDYEIHLF